MLLYCKESIKAVTLLYETTQALHFDRAQGLAVEQNGPSIANDAAA